MNLRSISNGKVSGTGTLAVESGILGAVLITTDATNAAVVKFHKDNSDGKIIYDISTKSTLFSAGPILIGSNALYYDITGTGAAAQPYEWVE